MPSSQLDKHLFDYAVLDAIREESHDPSGILRLGRQSGFHNDNIDYSPVISQLSGDYGHAAVDETVERLEENGHVTVEDHRDDIRLQLTRDGYVELDDAYCRHEDRSGDQESI